MGTRNHFTYLQLVNFADIPFLSSFLNDVHYKTVNKPISHWLF